MLKWLLVGLLCVFATPSWADYMITQGTQTTVKAFTLNGSQLPAFVPVDSNMNPLYAPLVPSGAPNNGVPILCIHNSSPPSPGNTQTVGVQCNTNGYVIVSQGGTWSIDNITGTVPLPTGASTSANQTSGAQKTQIVDGSGNVITSTSNNLNVQCANCTGTGVSATDGASFTAGASLLSPTGGFFQTTATSNPLTTGQQGMWQMTANRAGFVNLRNSSGTEIGTASTPVQVSLANTAPNSTPVKVDNSAVTQPVSISQATPGTTNHVDPGNPVGAATLGVNQVSVTTSATLIVLARTGVTGTGRVTVTVINFTGTDKLCLGPTSGVTTANGFCLPAVAGAAITLNYTGALYGIVPTTTQTVSYAEVY